MSRTVLCENTRSLTVRLPRDVAIPEEGREMAIPREGAGRVIVPANTVWDDFFAAPGATLAEREQRAMPEREGL